MWKCVKCEMKNPDDSETCFICAAEKSYSLRLAEEMKKRASVVEEAISRSAAATADVIPHEGKSDVPETEKGDIFGDAVYTRTHDSELTEAAYTEKLTPDEESAVPELPDIDDDESFLAELNSEKKKNSKKIRTIVRVIIVLMAVTALLLGMYLAQQTDDSAGETAAYLHDNTTYTVGYETDDETENIIEKDVLKCFA